MRAQYAQTMRTLLDSGSGMLLITLQYEPSDLEGPPFSVSDEEVQGLYGDWCDIVRVERAPATVKGRSVDETALLLTVR